MKFFGITGSVIPDEEVKAGEGPVVQRTLIGEPVTFLEMERAYKQKGNTFFTDWFGYDPFDVWVGRFWVGFWGIVSLIGIFFGTLFYFYQAYIVEGVTNILQARLDPPPISAGLRFVSSNEPGYYWQLITIFATIAFFGWLMRQVEISRKLEMTYEIPLAYAAVFSSFMTLQWFRPLGMGAWGNGFAYGITHHLDWVSNIGYQYFNFFYNPFHAIAITLFFLSGFILTLHGSIILMMANRPFKEEENEDAFFRSLQAYSVGEIGIHRLGLWAAIASVMFANLCIYFSGTLVFDWNGFWYFWDRLPLWTNATFAGFTVGAGLLPIAGIVIWRGRKDRRVDAHLYEYTPGALTGRGVGLEDSVFKKPFYVRLLDQLFDNGQVGPLYVGVSGVLSLICFAAGGAIIFEHWAWQVDYNMFSFTRDFFVLSLDPPPVQYGLSLFAPWHEGNGAWVIATFLWHFSVIFWTVRLYNRCRQAGIGYRMVWGFGAALFLYFSIYLFRPLLMGNWRQAPGQGFGALLDWTNNVSVMYGNFYYNPFHMLSIFFLFGSAVLLAMHGGTIVAASKWGAHREVDEMMVEGSGTHRAQLFWRWCMGWNVNSRTIHEWSFWFGSGIGITGAIGILLSGTVILDWYSWAITVGIVAP
ncbi:MAG: bifunctional photosynthetic reaction center subunit L/M [Chloroflexota bacterium]